MNEAPLQIAVVDDEASVRKALERLIRSARMEARIFPSGSELLDALGVYRPDCVVLDLHMPRLSGFDVQVRLARTGLMLPVVVITGHDTPEARTRALAGGAAAYLLKPVDDRKLLDAIAAAIAARHA